MLRLEPYGERPYGCVYCYGRWYPRRAGISRGALGALRKIAKYWSGRELEKMPFRLSTLAEPFQPLEGGRDSP